MRLHCGDWWWLCMGVEMGQSKWESHHTLLQVDIKILLSVWSHETPLLLHWHGIKVSWCRSRQQRQWVSLPQVEKLTKPLGCFTHLSMPKTTSGFGNWTWGCISRSNRKRETEMRVVVGVVVIMGKCSQVKEEWKWGFGGVVWCGCSVWWLCGLRHVRNNDGG